MRSELISETYQRGTLSYLLLKPDLLSITEYKVLQGQEHSGLARCIRVIDNGYDKLVYDTDKYQSLDQLLASLTPDSFYIIVGKIISTLHNVHHIGFLTLSNVIFETARIFVDPDNLSLRLVYLPIAGIDFTKPNGLSDFKKELANLAEQNKHLVNETVKRFCKLLSDEKNTLEHLRQFVDDYLPSTVPQKVENFEQTNYAHNSDSKQPKSKVIRNSTFIFRKRKDKMATDVVQEDTNYTEILDPIFIPSIVIKSVDTSKKIEFVIDKHNYVLGKKAGSVDGVVDASDAVSRIHCRIIQSDSKNFIVDLSSANGTYLNGKKLEPNKPVVLSSGDKIKLADVTFVVKSI